MTALGIGSFIGSALTLGAAADHRIRWFTAGAGVFGLAVALMGTVDGTTLSWGLLVVAGAGNALLWTFGADLISRLLPDHVAGRGWGAVHAVGAGAYALGSLAAPLLSGQFGLPVALMGAGLALLTTPLLGWSGLRVVTSMTTPHEADVRLLASIPGLTALPGMAVSRIACAAETRCFVAGATVVREGTPGEEFFVVRAGELAVTQGGTEVRRLYPGDSFGEIALLRPVSRTATVVAVTDVELLSVGQELFVASITGHRSTDVDAEEKVTALLEEDQRRAEPGPEPH